MIADPHVLFESNLMKAEDAIERLERIKVGKWDCTIIFWDQAAYILNEIEKLKTENQLLKEEIIEIQDLTDLRLDS